MTQKELIEQLKSLKEIKPRKEWVVLLKSQILAENQETFAKIPAQRVSIFNALSNVLFQRKLAYAFAAIMFLIIGIFGFAQYTMPGDLLFPIKKITEQSQAALTGQTGLQQSVATLNNRINDLAQVAKEGRKDNIPSAISEVNISVLELAKNLKNNPLKDALALKEITESLKTLASVPGTDLSANPDVKDLYQTVVESQIADLEEATLTDSQKNVLTEIKNAYDQGRYTDALEQILLINK